MIKEKMELSEDQKKYKQIFEREIDPKFGQLKKLLEEKKIESIEKGLEHIIKKQEQYLRIQKCSFKGYDKGQLYEVYALRTASLIMDKDKQYIQSSTCYVIKDKTLETLFVSPPLDIKKHETSITGMKRSDIKLTEEKIKSVTGYPVCIKILEEQEGKLVIGSYSETQSDAIKIVKIDVIAKKQESYELPYESRFKTIS
ncbi:MAG: hypothetical protein QXK76_01855 [Candidatus Woesearchaeota archaeon]